MLRHRAIRRQGAAVSATSAFMVSRVDAPPPPASNHAGSWGTETGLTGVLLYNIMENID
jgi:hypothetical protein